MSEHREQLKRTSKAIGPTIMSFYESQPDAKFHAEELQDMVIAKCGKVAPPTSSRVLRNLRQKGKLNYKVIDAQKSLYQFLPLEDCVTEQLEQLELFKKNEQYTRSSK